MLVIDRKIEEGFWIGDEIFIKIISISRHRIKIGIEAPSDVPITREELRERDASKPGEREKGREASS